MRVHTYIHSYQGIRLIFIFCTYIHLYVRLYVEFLIILQVFTRDGCMSSSMNNVQKKNV